MRTGGSPLHTPITVSISGKGGAGKTTLTILLLKYLLEQGSVKDILLVDADADANLSDMLPVEVASTVGALCDRKSMELGGKAPKETGFRQEIWESVAHGEGFDLLVMGRTKGEGCYCIVNTYLAKVTEAMVKLYDVVLIDFDAGLEHLSRETDRLADVLLVVTDPSKMGFETARRIKDLTQELGFDFRKEFLVGSKFSQTTLPALYEHGESIGLVFAGALPNVDAIAESNLRGASLLEMPWDDAVFRAVDGIWKAVASPSRGSGMLPLQPLGPTND